MMLREGNEGYEKMHPSVLRFKQTQAAQSKRNMSLHSNDWFFGLDEEAMEPGMMMAAIDEEGAPGGG